MNSRQANKDLPLDVTATAPFMQLSLDIFVRKLLEPQNKALLPEIN